MNSNKTLLKNEKMPTTTKAGTRVLTPDVEYKILMLGESRVGKTSLIKRFNNDAFSESTISTVGIDFVNVFRHVEGVNVKLQIW